jgi:hypothetical protein
LYLLCSPRAADRQGIVQLSRVAVAFMECRPMGRFKHHLIIRLQLALLALLPLAAVVGRV